MAADRKEPVTSHEGPPLRTVEEHEEHVRRITERLESLNDTFAGQIMPDEAAREWDLLNEELVIERETIKELKVRHQRLEQIRDMDTSREDGATFHVKPNRNPENIYDLIAIRQSSRNPEDEARLLRDSAARAIDEAVFPHERAVKADVQQHISQLMERFAGMDEEEENLGFGGGNVQRFCRHILSTGSPLYRRAFRKAIRGRNLNTDEQRALSLTGASGGFAVPYQLDPTIIPTSNSSVNPYRAVSRVESITVDEWRGVSSAGVVASYAAEAAQATDDTPTLAQPIVSTERCQVFIPYSFEVGQDWGSLEAEMATLIQDAKDDAEASKFTNGSGTNEPFGLVTGATTITTAGGTAAFAIADLYLTEGALGPRFRPRAQWVGNRATYNRARQFDTSGGSGVWLDGLQPGLVNQVPTPGSLGPRLLGYPANEVSSMDAVLTTGSKILVFGDFRYFIIVDRIGMAISQIPHLFGANQRPTGQSGLYAFWRNSSKVLDANAFRTLKTG